MFWENELWVKRSMKITSSLCTSYHKFSPIIFLPWIIASVEVQISAEPVLVYPTFTTVCQANQYLNNFFALLLEVLISSYWYKKLALSALAWHMHVCKKTINLCINSSNIHISGNSYFGKSHDPVLKRFWKESLS